MHTKRNKNGTYGLAALISFLTFVLYARSLRNDFINLDDVSYVIENPIIRSFNLNLFKRAFFDFHACNWHPLTWISHALDYALWKLNPLGHHLTNNVFHALNTFVVVILITRLLEVWRGKAIKSGIAVFLSDRAILIISGVSGVLFGFHPLHVESVAWVAERKDVLCALFFLLSILAYTKYAGAADDKRSRKEAIVRFFDKQYLLALGFFALALLSKPIAVTLPVVLLVLDWYPFTRIQSGKTFLSVLVEKIPFFVLSLGSSILTILAQESGGALRSAGFAPLSTRLIVAAQSLLAYLGKMILPIHLVPYYQYPEHIYLFSFESLFPIVLVIATTVTCMILIKKNKLWLAVWGYYITTLIPVLGIVQAGSQAMADRYMYLPSLGPFLVIGLLVAWVSEKVHSVRKGKLSVRLLAGTAGVIIISSMAFLTFRQVGMWKDSITLWSYTIEQEPGKIPLAYVQRGRAYAKKGQFIAAIEDYNKATTLDPTAAEVFVDCAFTYLALGQVEPALAAFKKACALGYDFGCKSLRYFIRQGS